MKSNEAFEVLAMELTPELLHQVLSLPALERYELAHQMLDSIDEAAATGLDQQFVAELTRRRQEMLQGQETVADWRAALSSIEQSLGAGK